MRQLDAHSSLHSSSVSDSFGWAKDDWFGVRVRFELGWGGATGPREGDGNNNTKAPKEGEGGEGAMAWVGIFLFNWPRGNSARSEPERDRREGRAEEIRLFARWTISEWVSVEPTVAVDFSALLRRGPRSGFSRRIAAYCTNATHDPTERATSPSAPASVRLTTDETSQLVARPLISGTRSTADLSVAPRPPSPGGASGSSLLPFRPSLSLSHPCPSASRREVGFIAPRVARSLRLAASSSRQCATSQLLSSSASSAIEGLGRPGTAQAGRGRDEREEEVILIVSFDHRTLGGPARMRRAAVTVAHSFGRPSDGRSKRVVCVPPSRSPQAMMACLTCLVTRLGPQIDASSYFRCSPARAVILLLRY